MAIGGNIAKSLTMFKRDSKAEIVDRCVFGWREKTIWQQHSPHSIHHIIESVTTELVEVHTSAVSFNKLLEIA